MEYRIPSSASAIHQSSVRRRSSAQTAKSASLYSPSQQCTPRLETVQDQNMEDSISTSQSSIDKEGLAVRVKDVDVKDKDHTVFLVRPLLQSTSTNSSGKSYANEDKELPPLPGSTLAIENLNTFSTVPLTPRPNLSPRLPSQHSETTVSSQPPRLPTPDFSSIRNPIGDILSFFGLKRSRPQSHLTDSGLVEESSNNGSALRIEQSTSRRASSLLSKSNSAVSATTPRKENGSALRGSSGHANSLRDSGQAFSVNSGSVTNSRPNSLRSDSEASSSSFKSSSSRNSRLSEASFLTTSEKFTNKWPRPSSIRGPPSWNGKRQRRLVSGPTLESGSGLGLGLERFGRWTIHKWFLMMSVMTVFVYGTVALVYAITTWYRTWPNAEVMYVADNDILTLITLASTLFLFASLVGLTGTLLNSRPLLAVYTLLLWPGLIAWLAVGYVSYRRVTFSLDGKLNLAWSEWYTVAGRLAIQNTLGCCGFYDAIHDEAPSSRCYPRTPLPGCKALLYEFEQENLSHVWQMVFSLLPLHLINIVIALLCSNHVTRTFGKGIMPRQYWLRVDDVRRDAHELLAHFASVGSEEGATRRPDISRAGSSTLYVHGDRNNDFCVSGYSSSTSQRSSKEGSSRSSTRSHPRKCLETS